MCLAIPMRVASIDGDTAVVETGGLSRKADISLLKSVRKGDYILIHAGFAIERVNEKEAAKTLKILQG